MKTKFQLRKIPLALLLNNGRGEGEDSFTQEDLDTKIAEALSAQKTELTKDSEGLNKKNTELLATLKTATEKLKTTEGIDIQALLDLQKTVENDEILSLMASGKHSEALEKSTEKMRVTHSAEIESLSTKLADEVESSTKNKNLVDSLLIDGGSKTSFIKAKGLDTALEDIALRARQVWKVEEGELVPRGADGEMMKGEKGILTMDEWAEGLKEKAPHLFPASESAGAQGGKGGSIDLTTIDGQMVEAAKKGDTKLLRELKKKKQEGAR